MHGGQCHGNTDLACAASKKLRLALKDAYSCATVAPTICEVENSQVLDQQLHRGSWDIVVVHQSLLTDITRLPQGQFAVITQEPERTVFLACLKHGLRGYLLESSLNNHLLITMFLVPGVLLIDPALADWLASCLGADTQEPTMTAIRFTAREREVFDLVKQGLSSKQIAELLVISENTVKTHRGRISHKLTEKNKHCPTKE